MLVDNRLPCRATRFGAASMWWWTLRGARRQDDIPADIPLRVLAEDEHVIVVDKPAGLVTHPAAGHTKDTLLNALVYRFPELNELPRGGIAHRLDKDTSGLLAVARSRLGWAP